MLRADWTQWQTGNEFKSWILEMGSGTHGAGSKAELTPLLEYWPLKKMFGPGYLLALY